MNPTESELVKTWWWRDFASSETFRRKYGFWGIDKIGFMLFKQDYERSAFLHELSRRMKSRKRLPGKSWIELSRAEKYKVVAQYPMDQSKNGAFAIAIDGYPPAPGWTPFFDMSWNLNVNDNALVRAFLDFIEDYRLLSGVRPKPNQGRKRRPLSWRPIELLDIQRSHIRSLNDAERSQISQARKLIPKTE